MTAPVEVIAYTDGGARGNPGPAGVGVHMTTRSGRTVAEVAEAIGRATNNVAEYTAVIRALEKAAELGARRVLVRADSQLVVEQLRGTYRVKNPKMQELFNEVRGLIKTFDSVGFEHVPRAQNKKADALVNLAIDQWLDAGYGDEDDPPPDDAPASLF